ncbi:MFS transporter [Pelagibacterium montanilacus]|uniref:MFS transporter n=1 Tax=Pelagibacterium montanilacus TaxID=2185280 RepID=UPI000F8D1BE6|nr:MFS transporter [Pelagibacterium montanilacus]
MSQGASARPTYRAIMKEVPGLPMVMASVAAHMMMFGMLTPVMAFYALDFGVAEWAVGLMIALFALGRLGADLPTGYAVHRFGIMHLLFIGPLVVGAGSLLGAFAPSYELLLAGRLMQGIGSGIYMTAATVFCANAVDKDRRGMVMALFQGALLIGAAFGPVTGGIAAALWGNNGPFLISAAIALATSLAVSRLDADVRTAVDAKILRAPHEDAGKSHRMLMLLLLPGFAGVLIVNFAVFLTRTAAQWQMIPLFAETVFAFTASDVGLALTLSALANLAVLPASGHLVNRFDRPRIIVGSTVATALSLALVALVPLEAAFWSGMVLMGAFTGIGGPAVAAYAVDISPPAAQGPAMGLMRFTGDIGYLVGPLMLGLAIDLAPIGYGGGILLNGAIVLLAAVLFVALAPRMSRQAASPVTAQPTSPTKETTMTTERIWDKFLTERDKQVFEASGYGALAEWGKRPALLVIDVNYAFTGESSMPILDSIKKWRNSCGEEGWAAVPVIADLADTCRAKGVPVIYTTGIRRPDGWDGGSWLWKNSRAGERPKTNDSNRDGNTIVDELAPAPQDLVVYKQKPSGFFGTPLQSYLQLLGCDSVIVTGTTTSGCVRATVLDAFSQNFRVTIVEDGCFDRSQASHAINLCDMNAKYANVRPSKDIRPYLEGLEPGMFDLPSGAGMAPMAAE